MSSAQSGPIRNISDTALWVAIYRADESDRPDAVFHDPFARKLAGERGEQIHQQIKGARRHSWAYVARTWQTDRIVTEQVANGVDMVINLACGLDTRPFRMDLPAALKWIEIDMPDLIAYKREIMGDAKPRCDFRQIALDLSNVPARRELFAKLGAEAKKALIISEGLIVYLTEEENIGLAKDLAAQPSFRYWVMDPASPALLKMLQKQIGNPLAQAGAPLKFAPKEGPDFWEKFGWHATERNNMLLTAKKLKRLPWLYNFFALFPDPAGKQPEKPWSAVCLFEHKA